MTQHEDNLLTFDEFRSAVGAAEYAVRRAIKELDIHPIPRLSDMRYTGYKLEWVDMVRNWLLSKRGS